MKTFQAVLCFVLVILFGGCASSPQKSQRPDAGLRPPAPGLSPLAAGPSDTTKPGAAKPEGAKPAAKKPPLPSMPAGLDSGLVTIPVQAKPQTVATSAEEKQKVILNYDKADVAEVTNQIFGEYLKLNYVLDPTLQGRISLYLEGEFTKGELLQMVKRAYDANNISIVSRKGMYFVQPIQRSATSNLPLADSFVLKPEKEGVAPLIVIYRLRYMDAKQAINTVRFFLTPGRPITVDSLSNSIIFAEDSDNARTILDVLKALDMNVLKEVGMEVVPLQALTPEEAVQSMETLIGKLDMFKESAIKTNLAFIPLQRFGGVLILAQNPEVLKTAKQWLLALDVQGQESGEQIFVYFIQNSLAKDIGDILNQVFGLGGKAAEKKPQEQIVKSSSRPPSMFGSQGGQRPPSLFGSQGQQERTPTATRTPLPTQVTEGVSITTTLSGEVVIIADEVNNAIVVRANAADYAMVKKAIEALDIVPRAVLIEVLIAEITLTKDLQYGLDWFVKNGDFEAALGGVNFSGLDLSAASSAGLALLFNKGNVSVLVDLLASKTDVNVLSTPTLLATDNQEAAITVGGREPIPTGSAITTGDVAISNIQYEETGIILTVTPHINVGGLIRLDVDQAIRNVAASVTVGDGNTAPRFTERKIKTTLLAQDGSTVVIGGIIEQRLSKGKTGIPGLMHIPIISPLFSSSNENMTRTELIIAITPHVVDRRGGGAPEEFLEKLRQLKRSLEGRT